MEVALSQYSIWHSDSKLAILFLSPSTLKYAFSALDESTRLLIQQQIEAWEFDGNYRQQVTLTGIPGLPCKKLIAVGIGSDVLCKKRIKKLMGSITLDIKRSKAQQCTISIEAMVSLQEGLHSESELVQWLSENLLLAQYRYGDGIACETVLREVILCRVATATSKATELGLSTAKGIMIAKELSNLPGNVCTPTFLSNAAKIAMNGLENVHTKILNADEIGSLGMGAFMAIAQGSNQPGNITIIDYRGAEDPSTPPILLVGKGITFDTGGISLKARHQMSEMKFDMGGAAAVIGAVYALAASKSNANVVAVTANAENMPDANACRPGDVVKSMSGQTIEILDTDAEGRMVMCDALTYAIEHYSPSMAIDVATLTGSCIVALGESHAGLFTTNDALADALIASGESADDPVWRLPLLPEHGLKLSSPFADMANIGGRNAGASTAASFLSNFAVNLPWAHLDTAGVVASGGDKKMATGRPVSLLVEFIKRFYQADFSGTEA